MPLFSVCVSINTKRKQNSYGTSILVGFYELLSKIAGIYSMQKTSRCGLCYGFPTWTKKSSTEIGGWPALGRWSPWRMTKELPIVLEKPMASEDPSGWGWEGWEKVMVDHWAILSHGGISKMMEKVVFNCLLMWMTRFFQSWKWTTRT